MGTLRTAIAILVFASVLLWDSLFPGPMGASLVAWSGLFGFLLARLVSQAGYGGRILCWTGASMMAVHCMVSAVAVALFVLLDARSAWIWVTALAVLFFANPIRPLQSRIAVSVALALFPCLGLLTWTFGFLQGGRLPPRALSNEGCVLRDAESVETKSRYRFSFDAKQEKAIVYYKDPPVAEVVDFVPDPPVSTVLHTHVMISRAVTISQRGLIAATNWHEGVVLLDAKSFAVRKKKHIPRTVMTDQTGYVGVAYWSQRDRLLVARADGVLIILDLATLEEKDRFQMVSPGLFQPTPSGEIVLDIYQLRGQDELMLATFDGFLYRLNLSSREIERSGFLWGVPGNLVYEESRDAFYLVSFPLGLLFELDATTLQARHVWKVPAGLRYLALDRERRALFITNYVTGDLLLFDLNTHRARRVLDVGLRSQWIELLPGGKRLVVSNAHRVVMLDTDCLLGGSWSSDFWFPFSLFDGDFFEWVSDHPAVAGATWLRWLTMLMRGAVLVAFAMLTIGSPRCRETQTGGGPT